MDLKYWAIIANLSSLFFCIIILIALFLNQEFYLNILKTEISNYRTTNVNEKIFGAGFTVTSILLTISQILRYKLFLFSKETFHYFFLIQCFLIIPISSATAWTMDDIVHTVFAIVWFILMNLIITSNVYLTFKEQKLLKNRSKTIWFIVSSLALCAIFSVLLFILFLIDVGGVYNPVFEVISFTFLLGSLPLLSIYEYLLPNENS